MFVSVPLLIHVSIFTWALWYILNLGIVIALSLLFSFMIPLTILGLLCFCINFRIAFSSSLKMSLVFHGDSIESVEHFHYYDHFNCINSVDA